MLIQSRNLADTRKGEIIRLHHRLASSCTFKDVFWASYYRALYILCSNITFDILSVTWFLKLSAVVTISVMVSLDIVPLLIYFHISFFVMILIGFMSGVFAGLFYPKIIQHFIASLMVAFPTTFALIYLADDFWINRFNIEYPLLALNQAAMATIILAFICLSVVMTKRRWFDPTSIMYSTDVSYKRLKRFAKSIIHIKAEGHYVRLITDGSKKIIRQPFSKVIKLIDVNDGMKIHRSHWVSYRAIKSVEKKDRRFFVKLHNGTCAPVSAKVVTRLEEKMNKFSQTSDVMTKI